MLENIVAESCIGDNIGISISIAPCSMNTFLNICFSMDFAMASFSNYSSATLVRVLDAPIRMKDDV